MSKQIQVLLLENIPNYGTAGEIVSVSEGYARNFLFPAGKAALATSGVKAQKATEENKKKQQHEADLAAAQTLAETLEGKELALTGRVKEGSDIFGRITAKDIAKHLNEQAKLTLKPKQILLAEPITQLGTYDVGVELFEGVTATLKVAVTAEPGSEPKHDED
jgi:large subunit ribosomal protein L9